MVAAADLDCGDRLGECALRRIPAVVEIAARSEARTLAESRERDGAGFREALREALEAPREVIAAKLPRALNGIVTLD